MQSQREWTLIFLLFVLLQIIALLAFSLVAGFSVTHTLDCRTSPTNASMSKCVHVAHLCLYACVCSIVLWLGLLADIQSIIWAVSLSVNIIHVHIHFGVNVQMYVMIYRTIHHVKSTIRCGT